VLEQGTVLIERAYTTTYIPCIVYKVSYIYSLAFLHLINYASYNQLFLKSNYFKNHKDEC